MRIPGSLGDYWYEGDALEVRVAEYGNTDYETLIAVHEVIEEWLTKRRGLSEPEIQAFDDMWDKEQQAGKHGGDMDEPGFDSRCPCLREHTIADAIERVLIAHCGMDINTYNDATLALE